MAKERNMQVIVFNPNERVDPISREEIKEFSSMEKHCKYVWQEIIGKLNFSTEVYIVAHSMAGYCIADILADEIDTERITKIAFTDLLPCTKMKFVIGEKKRLYHKLEKVNFKNFEFFMSAFLIDLCLFVKFNILKFQFLFSEYFYL